MGGPRVDREAALLAAAGHEGAVVDLETEAETAFHLVGAPAARTISSLWKVPPLALTPTDPQAREQVRQIGEDRQYMESRLLDIDREIETEPAAIQDLYRVTLIRREPVGMVYLWPEGRG